MTTTKDTMMPMPEHLAALPWYPRQQAWCRETYGACRHDPGDAAPERADLSDADLSGAYLRGAYLSGAYLLGASLRGVDLYGADLRDADLSGAYLSGAYLLGASLRDADLSGAYLSGARGIVSAGPVGRARRIIYAVDHGDAIMVQAGCRWDTIDAVREAVRRDYDGDRHLAAYLAALDFCEGALAAGGAQ